MKTSQRRHSAAQSVKSAINTAVFQSITEGSHQIDPPKLSPERWDYVSIQAPENRAESERLEFLGDAVMDACIAIELYKTIPDGNPHKYTEIRSVVHSNFTFSHIVHKMGLRLTADTKQIGDIFETMVGAYYIEKGFQALYEWVQRSFEPILQAAALAFDEHQSQKARYNLDRTTSIPGPSGSSQQRGSTSPERGKGKRRFSEPVVHTQASASRDNTSASLFRQSTLGSTFSSIDDRSSRIAEVSHSSHGGDHHATSSRYHESEPRDSSSDSYDSDLEDSDALPDFWEEKRDASGQKYYVDHANRTTSWERPRRQTTTAGRKRFTLSEAEAAWTARLVAPLPPVPPVIEESIPSQDHLSNNRPSTHVIHPPVIVELLGDGYLLEDSNLVHFPSSSALPEFCEEVQADDGRTYYVDHPASTILLR